MKKFATICLLAFLFSCQSGKDQVRETAQTEAFKQERDNFISNMNTAKNTAAELQSTGAEFNASLLNEPANFSQYFGDSIKSAANLGVYLSDLNYSVAYNQREEVKELFNSAIALSRELEIDNNVLTFLMTRYNENISENDSVMNVVNELFDNATNRLSDASRDRLLGVSMAAYQIETLHLALGAIETYPKDILPEDSRLAILIPLYKFVLDQEENLEDIHTFFRSLGDASKPEQTPNYAYYDQALGELIDVYQRLDVDDAIANNRGTELMNDEVVSELREKVNTIRNKIVST